MQKRTPIESFRFGWRPAFPFRAVNRGKCIRFVASPHVFLELFSIFISIILHLYNIFSLFSSKTPPSALFRDANGLKNSRLASFSACGNNSKEANGQFIHQRRPFWESKGASFDSISSEIASRSMVPLQSSAVTIRFTP